MSIYQIFNAASPTTVKIVPVTSGTSLKTMLQVVPSATNPIRIVEWGISTTAPSTTTTLSAELMETDVAATSLTAHVVAGLIDVDALALANTGDQSTNIIQVGTSSTGYTAGVEGTITATRVFDARWVTLSSAAGYEYSKQFPLGREPVLAVGKFGRIRVHTATTAVDVICWMTVEV